VAGEGAGDVLSDPLRRWPRPIGSEWNRSRARRGEARLCAAARRLKSASILIFPRIRARRPPCLRRIRWPSLRSIFGLGGSERNGTDRRPASCGGGTGHRRRTVRADGRSAPPEGGCGDASGGGGRHGHHGCPRRILAGVPRVQHDLQLAHPERAGRAPCAWPALASRSCADDVERRACSIKRLRRPTPKTSAQTTCVVDLQHTADRQRPMCTLAARSSRVHPRAAGASAAPPGGVFHVPDALHHGRDATASGGTTPSGPGAGNTCSSPGARHCGRSGWRLHCCRDIAADLV
jgi:hypothetical protein